MIPRVLILGCGVGGLALTSSLAKSVGGRAEITVIERKPKFEFAPSFPWLMVGARRPEQVQRDFSQLNKKGIKVVHDEVTQLLPEEHVVKTKANSFDFDHLVVALGADYDYKAIPGFDRAHHSYDFESAIQMRDEVEKFSGGKVAVGVARTPFKCPAAPYEAALLIDHDLRKRGLRDKSSITFFTPEGQPLPAAGPEIGGNVLPVLKERGIGWNPKEKLLEIRNGACGFESGRNIEFDLLFCVPPHKPPKPLVSAGLTDETGWISVEPRTMQTKFPDVYALGDVASIATPHGYGPFLPKAGVFAHGQAELVAKNLALKLDGRQPEEWEGRGSCFLEVGYGKAAYISGNFLAQPRPKLSFKKPGRRWHLGKVLYEKYWLWKYF